MKYTLLVTVFFVEIIALAGFAALPFILRLPLYLQVILSALFALLFVLFWGNYMSPKTTKRLSTGLYYGAKLILYILAATSIHQLLEPGVSLIFIVTSFVTEISLYKTNYSNLRV